MRVKGSLENIQIYYIGWKKGSRLIGFMFLPKEDGFLRYCMVLLSAYATDEHRKGLWNKLTVLDNYGPSSSPNSIVSETQKYIHRLVTKGINCHPDTIDVVYTDDLNIMWEIDQGEPTNWFDACFSHNFIRMQGQYSSLKFMGCTSLITFTTQVCDFRFYFHHDEHREIDLTCVKKLSVLADKPEEHARVLPITIFSD